MLVPPPLESIRTDSYDVAFFFSLFSTLSFSIDLRQKKIITISCENRQPTQTRFLSIQNTLYLFVLADSFSSESKKEKEEEMLTFEDWWNGLGPMTRCLFFTIVVVTVGRMIFVEDPLDSYSVSWEGLCQLQLWRLLTAATYFGPFRFAWIVLQAMIIAACSYLENVNFEGRLPDFAWMMMLFVLALHGLALAVGAPFVSVSLLMALAWTFFRLNPAFKREVFFFHFPSVTLPVCVFATELLSFHGIVPSLVGVAVAEGYRFVAVEVPRRYNRKVLTTPAAFARLFPPPPATTQARRQTAAEITDAQRRVWGSGRVLGSS